MTRYILFAYCTQFRKEEQGDSGIMSSTMMEHFQNIVMSMEGIGAQRRGSKQTRDGAGKKVILDEYVLPNGKTIMAGYLDTFS